jgi:hypothetical protein
MKIWLLAYSVLAGQFFLFDALASDRFSKNLYCDFNDSIEKFACMTHHAAEGIKLSFALEGVTLSKDEVDTFAAIEAMNLVQNVAGSGRYAYLSLSHKDFLKPTMTEQAGLLTNGYGICGNHQYLFVEILNPLGILSRAVDFYFSDSKGRRNSHAAAEVKIGNKWRYFDVTWGSFWLSNVDDTSSLMAFDDVKLGRGNRMGGNNSWFVRATHKKVQKELRDPFSYLGAKDLQVLRNKGGILLIRFKLGTADFTDIPNYFGKSLGNAPLKIKVRVKIPPSSEAEIDIAGVGGACKESVIRIGANTYPVRSGKTLIRLSADSTIEVEGRDDICYAVISSLNLITKH